jgi:signal transduction histidine kinase
MNAVHYAEDNKAKITLSSKDGRMQISIANAGKTLAEEEQTLLFNQHFRGKNALYRQGFGMGLFLSQSILAFHGARISYHAKEEENVFTVSFPPS